MIKNKDKSNFLKRLQISLLIVTVIFSTGCWDKIEIDERAFVLAIAVDMAEGNIKSESSSLSGEEFSGKIDKKDYIKSTFFMPIPSKLISGSVDAFATEESEGLNMQSAIQSLSMKFSRKMFFGQTTIILIGESLIKNEKAFREFVDFLEREPDMGREAKIAILEGKLADLKNIKPKFEKVFAAYAGGVFKNANKTSSALELPINEFLAELRGNNGKTVIPVVSVESGNLKMDKLALVNEFKFKNYLETKYMRPLNIITGNLTETTMVVPYSGNKLTFKTRGCDTKIQLVSDKDHLKYKITAKIEGDIDNYLFNMDMSDTTQLKNAQNKIRDFVENELKKTISHFQNDIGSDYLMLEEHTKKHNYSTYEKYKSYWDEEFKKASFVYDINIHIRRLGGVKR
jgi:Ger(x)C family germination protein